MSEIQRKMSFANVAIEGSFWVLMILLLFFFSLLIQHISDQSITTLFDVALVVVLFSFFLKISKQPSCPPPQEKKYIPFSRFQLPSIQAILFISALIPRITVVLLFRAEPFNDFSRYFRAAQQWYKGDTSFMQPNEEFGNFFVNFPDSFGFVKYQSILVSLFGNNPILFQLSNCLTTAVICVLIYVLAKKINQHAAVLASLLYAIYPPNIFFTTVLTNQHMATLLALLSIWILLRKPTKSGLNVILAGISGLIIGFSHLIRPESQPYVLALFILLVMNLLSSFRHKKSRTPLNRITLISVPVVFIAVYFAVISSFGLYLRSCDITDTSSDLRYKFVTGLSYESMGRFHPGLYSEFFASNTEHRNSMLRKQVSYYVHSPQRFVLLQSAKASTQYAETDPALFWALDNKRQNNSERISAGAASSGNYINIRFFEDLDLLHRKITDPFYGLILMLGIYGLWRMRKSPVFSIPSALMLTTVIHILVYMFIEVQPRYRYLDMPAFFIFGALGLVSLLESYRPVFSTLSKLATPSTESLTFSER